jgi:NTE family protein
MAQAPRSIGQRTAGTEVQHARFWARWAAALLAAIALAGCSTAHYPVNPRLDRIDANRGYRANRVLASESGDTFVMHLSFSGGGTRAAAFGFGVLEALRDTPIVWQGHPQRLIDQLDFVMGASGGSILAAAYALTGVDGMAAFEANFLKAPLQQGLTARLLSPRSLWRMQSSRFGRGDLLAEYLDEQLFKGATFSDLSRVPRKPFLVIHASDIFNGGRFEFVQDQLDFLCGDLDGMPLARAVAASSAVPIVLSPITLWNYAPPDGAPGCGEPLLRMRAAHAPSTSGAAQRLSELESFRARDAAGLLRPYVHLLDGGLSDNVTARGPTEFMSHFESIVEGTRFAGYRGVRRAVFVVVNAETSARPPEDRLPDVPGPLRTALALADIPINRNSATALAHQRAQLEAWQAEVDAAHARGDFEVYARDARFYLIEVSLADLPDPAMREQLMAVPTSLELPAEQVDALRREAAAALRRSPAFQRLMRELEASE